MAKLTKSVIMNLIKEAIDEEMKEVSEDMYMNDGGCPGADAMDDMPMGGEMDDMPMGGEMDGEMDLASEVAELKGMMQQLMDMMGGQKMMEITGFDAGKPEPEEKEDKKDDKPQNESRQRKIRVRRTKR
jgi:hypothetical protein